MRRPPSASVRQHVQTIAPRLAPAERRVAEALLANPSLIVEKTITEVAHACHTSETTVVRFCRTAGFRGYPDLRLALAGELGRDTARHGEERVVGADISRDDSLEQLVGKVAYTEARAVEETIEQLDLDQLGNVIDALIHARRISLFGLGASGFTALDLQHKLIRIDRMAFVITDPHLALASAALLTSGDVAMAFSHSGETAETVGCLRAAAEKNATTIAVTNDPHSPLAESADLLLTTAARETRFRSGAMASRIAQLAVVDCVYLGVAQRTYDATIAALTTTHHAVHEPHTRRRRR
jgi:DNA-binding MurR/RpiR family transcriptional regulator